jgi:hypothetical protein
LAHTLRREVSQISRAFDPYLLSSNQHNFLLLLCYIELLPNAHTATQDDISAWPVNKLTLTYGSAKTL